MVTMMSHVGRSSGAVVDLLLVKSGKETINRRKVGKRSNKPGDTFHLASALLQARLQAQISNGNTQKRGKSISKPASPHDAMCP